MSQPEQEGAYLIQCHGPAAALGIAAKQLDDAYDQGDEVTRWHMQAVYCYVKGYGDALSQALHHPAAVLQAALEGVNCQHMARAWRNRSIVTQCEWVGFCRNIFDYATLAELHREAARVYAACSWYARRVGSDTFDGAIIPAKGWELIATLVKDFEVTPPDQALSRGAWEAKKSI